MQITHYLYNAYLIESGDKKIAIDPGGLFLYYLRLSSLIPKSEWAGVTHIFITHGDPDHYWHADRVAEASGAAVICNKTMLREVAGEQLMLGPRSKGLAFTTAMQNVHPIAVDETLEIAGLTVCGLKTTHGSLVLKLGPFSTVAKPGPDERVGWGAIGFDIRLDGKRVVNLGDTLLHAEEWSAIERPDVLMIPIGGRAIHNTMDEDEALEAVRLMKPALVLPCHYNCPAFFTDKYNPADDAYFKREVEKLGSECAILRNAESVEL
ncbi:MAG: MBL fold metallo-hydrolase [Rhodothermales bacterium]|nr:MBL fold metallo-hydrolase [Rhodothermales bacterium]